MMDKTSETNRLLVIEALNSLGIKTNSALVDFPIYDGRKLVKLDFSACAPEHVLEAFANQVYAMGISNGHNAAQQLVREALGL